MNQGVRKSFTKFHVSFQEKKQQSMFERLVEEIGLESSLGNPTYLLSTIPKEIIINNHVFVLTFIDILSVMIIRPSLLLIGNQSITTVLRYISRYARCKT